MPLLRLDASPLRRFARRSGAVWLLVLATMLHAADDGAKRVFKLSAAAAENSLKAFSQQSGRGVIFVTDAVKGIRTNAVHDKLTAPEALARLLNGTGLVGTTDEKTGAFAVRRETPDERKKKRSAELSENKPPAHLAANIDSPQHPENTMKRNTPLAVLGSWLALALAPASANAQAVTPTTSSTTPPEQEQIVELTPFVVQSEADAGYMATTTLAGTRLRTNLSDIGTAISVLTSEFLSDIGATDNQTALAYALNTEVGGVVGNYQNAPNTGSWGQTAETEAHFSPNTNTRVRGLVSADNTLNYFRTNVAWDSYNVERIDLLRGPNSILFGLGSPGGVINASTDTAHLTRDSGEVRVTTDEFGSFRSSLNYNKAISKGQLALRVAALRDREKYKQEPAYDDEDRLFLATKYKPRLLNRNGVSFELSADFQRGIGDSNRPRTAPPLDWLSPWVQPRSTLPIQLPAGTNFNGYEGGVIPAFTQFANHAGVTFHQNVTGGYDRALSGWADAFGPRLHVNSNAGGDFWRQGRVWVEGVRLPNGNTYFGNPQASRRLWGHGNSFQDRVPQSWSGYLVSQRHPFGNAFIPPQITDPSIYDFYNRLLDGPNKEEWNDFTQARVVLSNTFLNQKIGYELSYFKEDVDRGQTTFLSDIARIFVDTHLEDIEGNPNPDFGRPYVQETTFNGNRLRRTEIEGFRASTYFDHNFRTPERSSWWRSILGRQVLNAAYSEDEAFTENINFQRHVLGPEFVERSPNNPLFNNRTRVSVRYYVGDSLAGRSSLAGTNLSNLDRHVIPPGGQINLRYFDTTWNAPASVRPNAPWVNPRGQRWEQASNPANYAGWTDGAYTITDALSGKPGDLEAATRAASLQVNDVESRIFTWQGYMLGGVLVGTYGWREDESSSAKYDSQSLPPPYNSANLAPDVYTLDNPNTARDSLKVQSSNYSVVAHLNKLPRLGRKLPLNISLSYNEGENFNPTSGRRDVNGNFIPPPQGKTEEYGVLLATKDSKYSLRVMRYETAVLNSTSVQIPNANFRFNQFLSLNPRNMINDIESGDLREDYLSQATPPTWSIDAQEQTHGPAWRQFEREFAASFPGFIAAWQREGTWAPMDRLTTFGPSFVNTEDNISKGWEVEFTANPTRGLRLTLNGSKTNAERSNVPGASTRSVYEFIQNAMVNPDGTPTLAGGMRSGYDWINDTMADFWVTENWVQYGVTQQLNGQPAPELVEWRANAVANYTLQSGRLKGFGIGGALRWESSSTIGFPYHFGEDGSIKADIARGFKRPANDRYDVWFSYRRKLFRDNIDWSLQLNVFNVFNDDELIPVRANPDGQIANFRIQQGRSWRLSSSFRF